MKYAKHEREVSFLGQHIGSLCLMGLFDDSKSVVSFSGFPTLCFGGRTEPLKGKHHEAHKTVQNTLDYFLARPTDVTMQESKTTERRHW